MYLLPRENVLKVDRSQDDFGLDRKISIVEPNNEAAQELAIYNLSSVFLSHAH